MANTAVVYDRKYGNQILAFEPSGGLLNASLVMRDRETDSWWSIITGQAIGGDLNGTKLKEVPVSRKMQWKDWKALHPDTLVLSVRGREHDPRDPYERYFTGDEGFRGLSSGDTRLKDMDSIYAFLQGDQPFAVPHSRIREGALLDTGDDSQVFLYRNPKWSMFASTIAFRVKPGRVAKRDGKWMDLQTGTAFSERDGFSTSGKDALRPFHGFDTFWYIWSATHKNTRLLQ